MVRSGWYPDAGNPDERHYYDGQQWAGALPEPPAPPAGPDDYLPIFDSQPGRRRRSRGASGAVFGGVVIVVAAAITWAVWPSGDRDPDVPITFAGRSVTAPALVLRDAQRTVAGLVESENGSSNSSTRCYFARSSPDGDIEAALQCGPVLFPGGRSPASYVRVPVRATPRGSTVTLTAARTISPVTSAPARDELVRPDGARPPAGNGGSGDLRAPRLPAGPRDLLVATTLPDYVRPRATTASLVGREVSVTVGDITPLAAYGRGSAAKSAPAGQRLVAFTLDFGAGAVSGSRAATARAQLVSSDADARVIPALPAGGYVVAAIPERGSAYVALTDGGLTQRIDLPSGRPAPDVVAVTQRKTVTAALRVTTAVAAVATPRGSTGGTASTTVTLSVSATRASLRFWPPTSGGTRPSSPDNAYLSVDVGFTYPGRNAPTAFKPSQLRVDAGGRSYPARSVDGATVFEVPAAFTRGDLVISGRGVDPALITTVTTPRSIPIVIPTG